MYTRINDKFVENKLLIYCSQASLNEKSMIKVRELINRNRDWDYIVRKAVENHVFPQVYHNLIKLESDFNWGSLNFHHKMKAAFYYYQSNQIVLYSELRKILETLKAQQIIFMPLKGVALAEAIYPRRELRYFSDVDILFPDRREMERAGKALLKLGYQLSLREPYGYHFSKNLHGLPITFDLHHYLPGWSVFYPYPIIKNIWDTSLTATIEGVTTPIMAPENMFLVLSLHSFNKGTFTLRDLCDATEILKKFHEFDWSLIMDYAKQESWRYVLLTFLSLVNCAKEFIKVNHLSRELLNEMNRGFLNKPIDKYVQFPLSYTFLCRSCSKCNYCPVIIKEKALQNQKKLMSTQPKYKKIITALWLYFWENILVLKFVRPKRSIPNCLVNLIIEWKNKITFKRLGKSMLHQSHRTSKRKKIKLRKIKVS